MIGVHAFLTSNFTQTNSPQKTMFRQFSRRLRLTKLPFPDPFNPPPSNFYHRCSKTKPNLTFPLTRSLHISLSNRDKIFTDTENSYAYTILPPIPKLSPTWSLSNPIKTPEEFTQFLDRNWRGCRAPEIVEAFERVKDFCVANQIDLSDRRFDKLVDGLMDHCEKLTDDELLRLLVLLTEYPPCESSTSRNFHDIWSCLDDVCCWKMGAWDYEKMFNFAEIWYKLNLGRFSDFLSEVLDKATNKAHQLSKELVLYTFFYLNVARRKSVPFEFEHSVANVIQQLTLEELTIVAMGYFKTKTKVKEKPILDAMIKAINENCDSINEISLSAMLKVLTITNFRTTNSIFSDNQIKPTSRHSRPNSSTTRQFNTSNSQIFTVGKPAYSTFRYKPTNQTRKFPKSLCTKNSKRY